MANIRHAAYLVKRTSCFECESVKNKDMIKKLLDVRYNTRGQYKQLSDALNKNKPMHLNQSNKSCVRFQHGE